MAQRPNIVLVCVDQWRGDALGCAGHPVVETPYLDMIASQGTRFDSAYSAVPSCIAARAGLLTGQKQRTHGRVGYLDAVPWDYPVTLPGELGRHGYETLAVGKMHVYPFREKSGFQNVIVHDGGYRYGKDLTRDWSKISDYLPWLAKQLPPGSEGPWGELERAWGVCAWDAPEHLHPMNFITQQGIDFLRTRQSADPFFLYLSYSSPHSPCDPPLWAIEKYRDRDLPDVPIGDWIDVFAPWVGGKMQSNRVGDIDGEELDELRRGYYGAITHVDNEVGRVWSTLDELDLLDNTLFVFVADHGDLMGDHQLTNKTLPYEGSACIPFLVRAPGGSPVPGGLRAEPIELRDVMPTLLEAAGVPIPETVEGHSLLPLLAEGEVDWRKHVHGEHTNFGQSIQWVTDGREKFAWFSELGQEQFFDREVDPRELHDAARDADCADRVDHWRRILIKELDGREEGFTDGQKLIPGRPVKPCLSHLPPAGDIFQIMRDHGMIG